MAYDICATCRHYEPKGDGTGKCTLKEKTVKHDNTCPEHEED